MPRVRRSAPIVFGGTLLACGVAVSCILADPPAELPQEPIGRPTILHESVVPPVTRVLREWPREFIVPVDIDPRASFFWRAFLDFDPRSRAIYDGSPLPVTPDPQSEEGGIRMQEIDLDPPKDLAACHVLEIVVALHFEEAHTPSPPGGDTVVWFYSPTGDLSGCPIVDAGAAVLDGAPPPDDGSADAGD